MPNNQIEANHWYFQGFFSHTKGSFWQNEPKDWALMQVWDGNELKPAMPANHSGVPNEKQINMLYEYAQKGQLFLFELGDNAVRMLGTTRQTVIRLEDKEPVAPLDPGENASRDEKNIYRNDMARYNVQMNQWKETKEILPQLGENFLNAAKNFNAGRDMKWETEELSHRNSSAIYEQSLRNRDRADRVISEMFAPRPIASGDIFFKSSGEGLMDAAFLYDEFDKYLEPNGYDLPKNDKLDEYDAATINFALCANTNLIEEQLHQIYPDWGPISLKKNAPDSFNMMVTGMFGLPRISQPMAKCLGGVMQYSKENITKYIEGDPGPLGKALGESVRAFEQAFTNVSQDKLGRDMVSGTKLAERLLKLFDKNPDLFQATGLQDKDMEFMRGYIQLGKVMDNYLQSRLNLATANAHEKSLSPQERKEILADIVLRRMVERELIKENEIVKNSDQYKLAEQEAMAKDMAVEAELAQWRAENKIDEIKDHTERSNKIEQFRIKHDANQNFFLLQIYPSEHDIIYQLAKPDMLENLRQRLLNDPQLERQAQMDNFGIRPDDNKGKDFLSKSRDLDALTDQLRSNLICTTTPDDQKLEWFENMKALITLTKDGQDRPWLDPSVASDANRLMIALPNNAGGKDLVSVSSLLMGGLNAMKYPDNKGIDLLYKNALEGNLYYYQVGSDMPQRISIDGERTAVQQLEVPAKPNLWHKIMHAISGGRLYADMFNQQPDRDPAAFAAILANKDSRTAAIANEVTNHKQAAENMARQAAKEVPANEQPKENANEQAKENVQEENMDKPKITRGLKPYDKATVDLVLFNLSYKKGYAPKNNLGIDGDKFGTLVAMALGSPDLSIRRSGGVREFNKPEVNFPKIMDRYVNNLEISNTSSMSGFLSKAKNAVADGMAAADTGDYSLLGKIIANGLIQNNKVLMGCKQLDDRFTIYATMGAKALQLMKDDAKLDQAVRDALGDNIKQLDIANAAKNINNLRTEAMPLYQAMLKDFAQLNRHEKENPKTHEIEVTYSNVVMGNNRDIAKVAQLFNVEVAMNSGDFDLANTEYAKDGVVKRLVDELDRSNVLISFLADTNRVSTLQDPLKMKNLYEHAVNEQKQVLARQSQKEKEMVLNLNNDREMKPLESPKMPTG